MKIFKTDIKDKNEFNRIGYHYTKVYADDENHIYVFRMKHNDKKLEMPYSEYELVKGVKVKNPDGNYVYRYPSDEEFGTSGWFYLGNDEKCWEQMNAKIQSLLEHIG